LVEAVAAVELKVFVVVVVVVECDAAVAAEFVAVIVVAGFDS
jgi:hypothetical protein